MATQGAGSRRASRQLQIGGRFALSRAVSRPVSAEMSEPAEPAVAPPPGNPRFPLFDSLRAIAALSVVAFHVTAISQVSGTPQPGGWSGDLLRQLAGGVTVFFLISGFLLYRPFVVARLGGRPLRARDFARRRILRIVPAYWVALTALAIYPGLTGVFTSHWWVYYGYLQVYSAGTIDKGLPPAWSLCTEVTTRYCRSTRGR